jgi:hypothetical protein
VFVCLLDYERVVRCADDGRAGRPRELREEDADGERVRLIEARSRLVR